MHLPSLRQFLLLGLALLGNAANSQIYVVEPEPKLLTPVVEMLSRHIDTKGPLTLSVKPCGQVNAYWDNVAEITVCEEFIAQVIRQQNETAQQTAGRVDPQQIAQTGFGQVMFVVFHELAHALIDRHKLPFSGREEDTADQFAAYMLMESNNPNLFVGATNFFAEPGHMFKVFGRRQLTDEHALNIQRRAQILCWGYGREPRLMQRMVEHAGINPHRLQRCAEEYRMLMQNTPRVFAAVLKRPATAAAPPPNYGQAR